MSHLRAVALRTSKPPCFIRHHL